MSAQLKPITHPDPTMCLLMGHDANGSEVQAPRCSEHPGCICGGPGIDPELATAISVTTAEVEYAKAAEERAQEAFVQARAIGTRQEYLDADRAYSKARTQHLDALARLADLQVQAQR